MYRMENLSPDTVCSLIKGDIYQKEKLNVACCRVGLQLKGALVKCTKNS